MKATIKLPLIVVCVTVVAGCRSSASLVEPGDLPSNFPNHSTSQIVRLVGSGSDSLTAFHAKASVAVASPGESLSFSSDISHRRSDSLYMSVKPALGIEAARALVTPDSFFVYDRIKKKLYYGDIQKAGEFLPGPVSKDDTFGNMLGLPRLDEDWITESDSIFYFLKNNMTGERFTIDPRYWRVVRYERTGIGGDAIETMEYSEFDELDGYLLPRRVVYQQLVEEKSASIYYRSLELNPQSLTFTLKVSDSATPVPVQ